MTVTITGTFATESAVRNASQDLHGIGIPGEKISVDKDACRIRVAIPEATEREVKEILKRHEATRITDA